MDSYQRFLLNMIQLDKTPSCFGCNEYRPDLPFEILDAAQEGKVDVIKDYLNKNSDVNALHKGECLLSTACSEGQVEIVKLLLQCSDVHLNIKFNETTPLNRASRNGHLECVKLLIDAPVSCKACLDYSWRGIAKCLELKPPLKSTSAVHILRNATSVGDRDVLRLILQTEHHFSKDDLYPLVLVAIDQDHWDMVFSVFTRDFHGKKELINEAFYIAVNMRNWKQMEDVLNVIDCNLKFELGFVKVAFAGRLPEAEKLLAEGQYDPQTLNGNLLVLAAGGICDEIAELLMNIKNVYTTKTFSNALYLSALGYCAELLPRLLHNPETSYSVNDLHQANEVLIRLSHTEKREGYLVTYFTDYLKRKSLKS